MAGRDRLLRYCTRPPFALERLRIEHHLEGREERSITPPPADTAIRQVLYHPARPTRDGRTVLALSPLEFLAALSRLIPPPRVHRHRYRYRYHGVLAPNARLRERVVALGRQDGEALDDTASPAGHDLPPEAGTAES
ncbi:MAG TPA: transposase, partial [Longimicrobiales bacterium]|nr:transposase [Longimicrobiales bacterium]